MPILIAGAAHGDDCSILKYPAPLTYGNVKISVGSGWPSGLSSTVINGAIGYWDGTCDDPGTNYPNMCVGCTVSGAYPVTVNYVDGEDSRNHRCANAFTSLSASGIPTSTTITLYTTAAGYSCQPLDDALAHELGHVLGLKDPPSTASCNGRIMGPRAPGTTRDVTSADCAAVDQASYTPIEQRIDRCTDTCGTTCDAGGYCQDGGMTGYVGTPILIDLDGGGLKLVGSDDAVTFDLDADGTLDRITWTSAEGGDAFLVLDVNGNGRIDNGAELFGDSTLLMNGVRAPNGFTALAELDSTVAGGNGDGVITAADAVFRLLQLWVDRNHNAVSEDGELLSLGNAGVVALDTAFTESNHMDSYRNLLRYKSQARLRSQTGHEHTSNTYDVLFRR